MSDFLDGGLPGWPGWRTDNVERLYPLWTPGDPAGRSDFYTSTTPDGFQRIMGPWDGRINVCVCFLANGSDRGLGEFRACPKIAVLSIAETRVTDTGVNHLREFPALKDLWLNNKVTPAGLKELQGHPTLARLSFGGTTDY